ncbi:MAG: hypothetical protein AB7V42_01670 [Thermoleophilia bacterium]
MADGKVNGNSTGQHAAPGGATATAEPSEPAGDTARVDLAMARVLAAQTRSWLHRRQLTPEVLAATPRISTREWLVRAAFALFAVVTLAVVVFSALGLLNATEVASAMLPVSTLAAVIVGVYLGSGKD